LIPSALFYPFWGFGKLCGSSDLRKPPPEAGQEAFEGKGGGSPAWGWAAVLLAGDLLRWLIPAVAKFPRNLRYGLGGRLEASMLDVLEERVAAQYATGAPRRTALATANRRLQAARHLARLSVEVGALSERQGLYVAERMVALGNQVGAWHRASDGTENSSRGSTTPFT